MLFRQPEYVPDCSEKFGKKYFVIFYAPESYPVILMSLGMLEHIYFEPFPKILSYKNNKNTYKYIVPFTIIIDYGNICNDMKENIILIRVKKQKRNKNKNKKTGKNHNDMKIKVMVI